MFYTYILKSIKDDKLYIGYTHDLRKRFKEHQEGKTPSTKFRRPFVLIFYESFVDKRDAKRREKYFKTTKGKASLAQIIRYSIKNI